MSTWVERARVGAVSIDLMERDAVLERVERSMADGAPPLALLSVNLDHIHHFSAAPPLPHGVESGTEWLALLDGWPVASLIGRRRGSPTPVLPGSKLLEPIVRLTDRHGLRLGLVGGGNATRAAFDRLGDRFPGLTGCSTWPVAWADVDRPEWSADLAERVRASGVDVLVVSLGKPRQERWLAAHLPVLGVRVAVAFGSAADYLTEVVRPPPRVLSAARLEWAYRLAREPRRLSRRYLLQGPAALRVLRRDLHLADGRSRSAPTGVSTAGPSGSAVRPGADSV